MGIYQGGNFPGGNFPGGSLPGGSFLGGSLPGGSFPGGNFPSTQFSTIQTGLETLFCHILLWQILLRYYFSLQMIILFVSDFSQHSAASFVFFQLLAYCIYRII